MFRKFFLVVLLCAGSAAFGQGIYSWQDAGGQVHYSDMPPPDAKVRTVRQGPIAPAKPAPAADGSDAAAAAPSGGPQSYAEKELAFRKRRAETAEAEEKARKTQAADEARQRECAENRAQLTALESGQRMSRFDENGERVFLDDDERSAALERTRRAVDKTCR